MSTSTNQTPAQLPEKIRTLKIIHLAILGGVIFIYVLLGDISMEILHIPPLDTLSMTFFAMPFFAFALGNLLFHQQLKKADRKLSPNDNFGVYQTGSIIRWAILELAAFVILLLAPEHLIFGIFTILILAFLRPTETRVEAALQYLD